MEQPNAQPERVHGTLVEVAGVGVLLLGRSGIGKSECALELVMRGHRLIADDVVLLRRDAEGLTLGESPELIRHYIELRGIGIVHVPSLFGETAVAKQVAIDLVVQLVQWGASSVDRTGLERRTLEIAGSEFDLIELPVAPGRNMASLVEVAARNHLLRRQGRSAAAELEDRVVETLKGSRS